MSVTIGLVANVYNEINALPGWIETHLPFFDDVRVLHAGPGGAYSDDGTIELLEKWRIPVQFGTIDNGFGVVRTCAAHWSPCDWVMILDADERFYPCPRALRCVGTATPSNEVDAILQTYDFRPKDPASKPCNWENIGKLGSGLTVEAGEPHNQGARLREIVAMPGIDAIATMRRHWHDFSFRRPTQDWNGTPDWQLRTFLNDPGIYYSPSTKMHERLVGIQDVHHANIGDGPFFDHFHFTFKRMEPNQRAHDVAIYDAIHAGTPPPTREQFWGDK